MDVNRRSSGSPSPNKHTPTTPFGRLTDPVVAVLAVNNAAALKADAPGGKGKGKVLRAKGGKGGGQQLAETAEKCAVCLVCVCVRD